MRRLKTAQLRGSKIVGRLAWLAGTLCVLGFVLTLLPIDESSWQVAAIARVVMQLSGCLGMGYLAAVGWSGPEESLLSAYAAALPAAALVGAVLTWAPLLDLLQGPVHLDEALVDVEVERYTLDSRRHKREEICLGDAQHRVTCIRPLPPKLWWTGADLAECGESEFADAVVLRHLELAFAQGCTPMPPPEKRSKIGTPEEDRAGYAMIEELRGVPDDVAARRAKTVALPEPDILFTVMYGLEPEDRWFADALGEAIARREPPTVAIVDDRLMETYPEEATRVARELVARGGKAEKRARRYLAPLLADRAQ